MTGQSLTVTSNTSCTDMTGTMWVGDALPTTAHWIDWTYPYQTYPQYPVPVTVPQHNYYYDYHYPWIGYPNQDIYDKARKYDEIMKKHPKLKLEEKRAEIKALAKELGIKIKFV